MHLTLELPGIHIVAPELDDLSENHITESVSHTIIYLNKQALEASESGGI